jgi:hypothetical protein
VSGEPLPQEAAAAPRRSQALDLFKTVLVVGMIATHVIQLIADGLPEWTYVYAETINLVTFSGFLFAFGLGLGLSRSPSRPLWQRLLPVLLLLLAAYVSSYAYETLVEWEPASASLLVDIVTLRRLFGWSEFLATFAVLYLLLAVARPLFIAVAVHGWALAAATILCLASTAIIINEEWPVIATLVGTDRFASFPLLPYVPWLLVGIAIGRLGGVPDWALALAVAPTAVFYTILQTTGELPGRFPPTAVWIVGPALLLLLAWKVLAIVGERWHVASWLLLPGRHVLSYLLVSNLVLFTVQHHWERPVQDVGTWLLSSAAIIVVIGLPWAGLEAWRGRKVREDPDSSGSAAGAPSGSAKNAEASRPGASG